MDSSQGRELDRLNGALSAELQSLEKVISEGLSKKLTPALMDQLLKARKSLRNTTDLLRSVLQEIS